MSVYMTCDHPAVGIVGPFADDLAAATYASANGLTSIEILPAVVTAPEDFVNVLYSTRKQKDWVTAVSRGETTDSFATWLAANP